ncbi:MAG: nuclear transport factor 2 family protein [Pseudomonadota bacterium]
MVVNPIGRLFVVLFGLSLTACTPQKATLPETEPVHDPEVEKQLIDTVLNNLIQADRRGDAGAAARLFTEDAVLLPPGEEVVVGREEIERRFREGFAEAELDFELTSVSTEVTEGLALNRGERKGWVRWRNGRPAAQLNEKYLMHLRRDQEQWRIASLMWNRVKAQPSNNVADINFILQHGSSAEQATADTLIALIGEHELDKWAYTKTVLINDRGDIKARPVLSLNARHRYQKELLLATYLNAQLRWFLSFDPVSTQAAVQELRQIYPDIPVDVPTNGYVSLLAGYLEYQAMTEKLGHEAAFRALAHWTLGEEAWIYNIVLAETDRLGLVVNRHGLNY